MMIDDRILFNTRDGIERGSADGDATDDEVLFEKKYWRRLDWIGDTTRGVLMAVPIRIRTECSAEASTSITESGKVERAETR